jgi:DNA-binding NtrC family response regulator
VLPPLRERREDIPRLARHFTQRFARRMGQRIEGIPAAIMDALVSYPRSGNVRELQYVIERAVILSPGPALQISLGDLSGRMTDEGGRMNQQEQVHPSSVILSKRRRRWPRPSGSTSSAPSARPAGWWPARRAPRHAWG